MWSVGRRSRQKRAGVTLIEMLIVVTVVSLMVSITYPSIAAGVESLRISSAVDDVAGFLNAALNYAERRQQPVEVTISRLDGTLIARSADPSYQRVVKLPENVSILTIAPAIPGEDPRGRRFLLFPASAPPRIGVVLANTRGDRRFVRLDPISGVPQVGKLGPREQMP